MFCMFYDSPHVDLSFEKSFVCQFDKNVNGKKRHQTYWSVKSDFVKEWKVKYIIGKEEKLNIELSFLEKKL